MLKEAEKWRLDVIREITKKVAEIQNGEFMAIPLLEVPSSTFFLPASRQPAQRDSENTASGT